jgi:pimeloyl-ACP methyl ester carboxylesterase
MLARSSPLAVIVQRLAACRCGEGERGVTYRLLLCGVCGALLVCSGSDAKADEKAAVTAEGLSELSASHLRFGPEEFVNLFQADEYSSGEASDDGPRLRYRLFVPRTLEPGKKYALIVWVHGFGVEETIDLNRNTGQLMHTGLIFRNVAAPEDHKFYFLAPQNQISAAWFAKPGGDGAMSHAELLLALIDETLAKHRVDPERVTLVGISSGATASWEIAARRPELLAGMAPISGSGARIDDLEPLVGIPVWAFHNDGDNPEPDIRAIERLQSLGGCAQLTQLAAANHDSWSAAFNRHGLLQWLLARRKGEACPIENSAWGEGADMAGSTVAHALPALGTLVVVFAAILCLIRPPSALKRLLTSAR